MPDLGNTSVFSQTDGSNNSGTQPSWSGSAAPSTLDDAGRGLQGAVTREWNWRNYTLTAAGTADAKTLTYSVAPAAYYNGQRFAFIANTTNTGSATLNVNSLGAKTIKKDVSGTLTNLSASDMVSGMFVEVAYNTANDCFVWVNRGGVTTGNSNTFTANQVIEVTDNTNAALRVTQLGTGLALRIEDSANPDSTPVAVDASGNLGIGTASPGYILDVQKSNRVAARFGPATGGAVILSTNASQNIAGGGWDFDGTNFVARSTTASFINQDGGTFGFYADSGLTSGNTFTPTNRVTIGSTGSILAVSTGAIGYGTGSGGTVTQLTSKSTGVTINKTNGQIITHNAALATATEVAFTVTNSTVADTDNIILSKASGGGSTKYQLFIGAVAAGSFDVVIRNVSGTSGSDAITINFAVIKAVTS